MTTTGHIPAARLAAAPAAVLSPAAARILAVLRISLGFVFLWAFLDKTFGWGYATTADRAWVNGGSPTKGFLSGVEVGPFQDAFRAIAGAWWADWAFMLGLLGIGVALVLGIGLRLAAGAAVLMMALMWLAEFPLARQTAGGEPTRSSNPLVDYHVVYALGAVAVAATEAGRTWGLGGRWAQLPFVRHHRWLI